MKKESILRYILFVTLILALSVSTAFPDTFGDTTNSGYAGRQLGNWSSVGNVVAGRYTSGSNSGALDSAWVWIDAYYPSPQDSIIGIMYDASGNIIGRSHGALYPNGSSETFIKRTFFFDNQNISIAANTQYKFIVYAGNTGTSGTGNYRIACVSNNSDEAYIGTDDPPYNNTLTGLTTYTSGAPLTSRPMVLFFYNTGAPPPTGACCMPDGSCSVISQSQCNTNGGTYAGDNVTCQTANCQPIVGSCCLPNGTCISEIQAQCNTDGGVWTQGQSCSPNPCPPIGSCCLNDGTCSITAQANCAGSWTEGGSCTPNRCAQPAPQTSPAPMSKQLRIGIIGSGDNNIDQASQGKGGAWEWVAKRFGYYAGSGYAGNPTLNREEVDSLKMYNPNMAITRYDLHAREAWAVAGVFLSDTMDVIRYAQNLKWVNNVGATVTGIPLDSLVLIAGPGGVTLDNRTCPGGSLCGQYTTPAGGIVLFPSYATNQKRVMFNPRNKYYGWYMAHKFDSICTALNIDGIFGDEYGSVSYDYSCVSYDCVMSAIWPLASSSYWISGWNNFTVPFPAPFDVISSHSGPGSRDTCLNYLQALDTTQWFKGLTDSLVEAKGRIYFANISANGGGIPGYYSTQWLKTSVAMARLAKATAPGEYTYQYPGDGNLYDNCREWLKMMVSVRDFAKQMLWGWLRVGQYDNGFQGHSLDRSQMTAAGFMLDITALNKSNVNPYGSVDNFFLPCHNGGQTTFYWNSPQSFCIADNGPPNYTCTAYSPAWEDSLVLWSYIWGKYYGKPTGVLDTSQSGTDGALQPYVIDKAVFLKPGTTDTLTLSIGRIGRGTSSYDTVTTGVDVTLPGDAGVNWYPLRSRSHAVKWDAPLHGGDVIKIGNSHFQIFSRDTLLSNSGPSQNSGYTITKVKKSKDRH